MRRSVPFFLRCPTRSGGGETTVRVWEDEKGEIHKPRERPRARVLARHVHTHAIVSRPPLLPLPRPPPSPGATSEWHRRPSDNSPHLPVSTMTPSQSKRRAKRGLFVLDAATRSDAPRATERRPAAKDLRAQGAAVADTEARHCMIRRRMGACEGTKAREARFYLCWPLHRTTVLYCAGTQALSSFVSTSCRYS